MTSYIELGQVVGVWGVKGWIKLHAYTRQRTDIAEYDRWYLETDQQNTGAAENKPALYDVEACRTRGRGIVAKLVGIESREAAELLIGQQILVDRQELPALPRGEYYWHELIGLQVKNAAAETLGWVQSVLETGANDVIVVTGEAESASEEMLIPYIPQVIKAIDVEAGIITVDWEAGYL